MGQGKGLIFFHPPARISSCLLSHKRKEMRKVPFDINHLTWSMSTSFLISHCSRIFFFKQAICEQGKVLFSHLCDLKLEALILLISSKSLPHPPPAPNRNHIQDAHTPAPWRGGGGGKTSG